MSKLHESSDYKHMDEVEIKQPINTAILSLFENMEVHCFPGMGFDSNIYVVEADEVLLIDTGTGMYHKKNLDRIGKFLSEIDYIILTHRHFDHIGGAYELSKVINGNFLAQKDEAIAIMARDAISTCAADFGRELGSLKVGFLEEKLDLGNCTLRVIPTPGHTIGSIVLYDDESKSLFSADTVFTDGGVGRWDLITGNYTQLVSSLKKLTKLDVKNLYPGHGPYSEGNGSEHIKLGLEYLEGFG